jgi:hypothetical protein
MRCYVMSIVDLHIQLLIEEPTSQRTHLENIRISQLEDTFQLLFSLTCLSKLMKLTRTWDFVCPPQNEIACHKSIGFSVETARSPE